MNCKLCGKEYPNAIIFNTDPLAIAMYFSWQEVHDEMCWECYCKKDLEAGQ